MPMINHCTRGSCVKNLIIKSLFLLVMMMAGSSVFAVTLTASPTACENLAGIGTQAWSNPGRAVSSNTSYATVSLDGTISQYLYCHDFGFAVPAGATINGITVNVERRSSLTGNGGSRDSSVSLVSGGVVVGSNLATATAYTTSDVVESHGGATNLWGAAWTPATVNAGAFGVAFAATKASSSGAAHIVYVDHIQILVDYTPAPRACVSAASGNWSAAATWNCGSGPGDGPPISIDSATINNHAVSFNTSSSVASLTINSGSLTQTGTGTQALTVSGNITNSGSILDNGSNGSFDITVGGSVSNTGSAFTVDNLTVTGNVTSSSPMTVRTALSVSGNLNNSGATGLTAGTMTVSGTATSNAPLTATTFNVGGDLTSSNALTVTNLIFQKAGTQAATFYNSQNVVTNFTVNSGSTVSSSNYSTLNIKGALTNNGSIALPNTSWIFNGTSAQTIGGSSDSSLGNMTMNNSAGVTLSRNVTVPGTLTLTSGNITAGSYVLAVTGTYCPASISGGSAASYVIGNLRLSFPPYNATCTYPIGDTSAYAPMTIAFPWFAGISGGTLTGSTTKGQHPQINTSGINPLMDVNRYWTLGVSGDTLTSLPSGGSYNATFQFVAADILGGAQVSTFAGSRYTSGAWTSPVLALSSYTANSVSLSGLTLFGSFVTGQPGSPNPGQCSVPPFVPSGVTCYCDSFTGSNLTSGIFNSKWTVSTLGPRSYTPSFVSGRLRLTDNNTNEATSATLGAIFPAAGNYISVEFRQFAYNGSGADGLAVTLSDYSVAPNPGAFGGSLGYAQKSGIVGFAGGWIGVGFDEFGNYTNPTEGRIDGPGYFSQVVAVRGSYAATTPANLYSLGYPYLARSAVQSGSNTIDNRTSSVASRGYYYQVVIDARNYTTANKTAQIQVNRDTSCSTDFCPTTGYVNLLAPFDAYAPGFTPTTAQVPVPDNWQISFTGSTGSSTNIHEISGLRVCAQSIIPPNGTTASGFNAIDSAMARTDINVQQAGAHIYTKLVGVDFALNIAVLNSAGTGIDSNYALTSNKTVTVELIDNSTTANQAATCSAKSSFASTTMSFTSTDKGFKLSPTFKINSAYSNVLVRMKDSTTTACSSDTFAIRPLSLTNVTAKVGSADLVASGNGAGAAMTVKAGSDFSLSATASPSSNYSGTPSIVTANVVDVASSGAISPAPLSCAFSAADTSSGTASGTCQYREVGYFSLPVDALIDNTFTTVDQNGRDDCIVNSTSNTLSNGKYGCNIGTPSATSWGRFIPDHFELSAVALDNRSELTTCSNRNLDGFTYMGEPIGLGFSIAAKAVGGSTTENYDFGRGYSRLTMGNWLAAAGTTPLDSNNFNLWALDNPATGSATVFPGGGGTRLGFTPGTVSTACSGSPTNRWCAGVATIAGNLVLNRAATADGPYASFTIGAVPRDQDGVSLAATALNLDADQSGSNERAKLATTAVRFGLLQLTTAYGSELLPLSVGMEARFWNGLAFVLNAQDNCTTIQPANVASARVAGETAATLGAPSVTQIAAGKGRLRFASPGLRSTFRVCVDLGGDANCAATSSAAMSYMTGRWDGSALFDRDPSARAAFGLNRGAYLYYRENY
jgi:MSHA biogenesis protein MshQ